MEIPKSVLQKLDKSVQRQKDQAIYSDFKKEEKKKESTDKTSKVIVPNHTTFMEAEKKSETTWFPVSFSPVQLKVIVFIIKNLQPYIRPQLSYVKDATGDMSDHTLRGFQLQLFKEIDGNFYCPLPKKVFVKGRNYQPFAKEVEELSGLRIQFKRRNPVNNKLAMYKTNLFGIYEDENSTKKKERQITIEITKPVVEHLCAISVAKKGEVQWNSDYYNAIIYEVIMRCKRKYSGLLYFYLCTWRNRGGWRVKTEELRSLLGIPVGAYKKPAEYKRTVLDSSRDELKEIGMDFWFEADVDGEFTDFKLITPRTIAEANEARAHLVSILKSVHCSDEDINNLQPIITNCPNIQLAKKIVEECIGDYFKRSGTNNPIKNIGKYIAGALQKWSKNQGKN